LKNLLGQNHRFPPAFGILIQEASCKFPWFRHSGGNRNPERLESRSEGDRIPDRASHPPGRRFPFPSEGIARSSKDKNIFKFIKPVTSFPS
jgi:hypothetical protein